MRLEPLEFLTFHN